MHPSSGPGPPRGVSPTSPPMEPTVYDNRREQQGRRSRSGSDSVQEASAEAGMTVEGEKFQSRLSKESVKKLDQIIQNIFAKAGTVILQERMKVTPILVGANQEKRISRWFQIDTDDVEDFRDEFRVWKHCNGIDDRPPPMIIETYLDTSRLNSGQSLVIQDDYGKLWDVVEAVKSSDFSSGSVPGRPREPDAKLLLERWRVDLRGGAPHDVEEFGVVLPTVYKKAIVLLRSIYTATGILPAWKLARNSKSKGTHPALQVRCRVSRDESRSNGYDALRTPLFQGRGDVSTDFMFGDLQVPVGRFCVSVSYRNHCAFQVVGTESLLSSRIGMAISDDMFKPSLPHRSSQRHALSAEPGREVGSLPYNRRIPQHITEGGQRYGSLSTFHGEGPAGTSPISALRRVKAPGSDTSSSSDSRAPSIELPPQSLPVTGAGRPPPRDSADTTRRPSISFQPFKRGSLTSSPVPRMSDNDGFPSSHSTGRGSNLSVVTHARNRSSLAAGMPSSLRGGPGTPAAETPVAGSPRPSTAMNRFSSSFTHRRNRISISGTSRPAEDDQYSSGKQSLSSSAAQPGSGLLNEVGAGGSSGSVQTDDDNIQEFLKELDSKRTLQSFKPSANREKASRKTTAQLSKFQLMRESNNALTEQIMIQSVHGSTQMQRSSSASSRQLANVPGMSMSSSPGKPSSPHTPTVPSRLSENSSADYAAPARRISWRQRGDVGISATDVPADTEAAAGIGATAIDIPLSPRPRLHARRSSSAAHHHRIHDDDDVDAHRSISLGAGDREPPSLNELLHLRQTSSRGAAESPAMPPPTGVRASGASSESLQAGSSSAERELQPPGGLLTGFSSSPYPRRYGSSLGRGVTPPQSGSASGSLTGPTSRHSRGGYHRGGGATGLGVSSTADDTEDEPLLFAMSEIGREMSRRSLEEGRGGGSVGSGDSGRGGYEPSRGSNRRW